VPLDVLDDLDCFPGISFPTVLQAGRPIAKTAARAAVRKNFGVGEDNDIVGSPNGANPPIFSNLIRYIAQALRTSSV
jgi:hypothetical protein